ncbi:LuxR family transcriptional regulator/LuxR family transcriptional regulator, quorum-sensing system regulator CciR [Chromohalobacter canadensis]|uniref:LuxR family transcriptional regulator/LuxR family transcriptional regulator, quorum-sensing system regulator CciR n=1 Tax=Chromohalobacter canadensis TaxID=141389 RepID=A0A285VWR1_9GAMM|nr:LuxR family transcriptional regulator [Chromohalobacter canadensis]SOC58327.1 LuxR family transcriptional regulator/LuxR family transcriptional regulator, quorum-sensing system regulator CciR [Chromohalobacter canadensis]
MITDVTQALLEDLINKRTKDQYICFLGEVMEHVGIEKYAYAYVPFEITEASNITVVGNYDQQWVKKYKQEGYHHIDPVMRYSSRTSEEFFWDEIPVEKITHDRVVYEESAKYGIEQGFTIPIHDAGLAFSTINLAADGDDTEFPGKISRNLPVLKLVTAYAHQYLQAEKSCHLLNVLSSQEKKCLAWIASGKTYEETGMIMSIKERTVKFHVKNCMEKLDCVNIKQVVARAVRLGILE